MSAKGQFIIEWKEIPEIAKLSKEIVPEGKALFIFEVNDEYIFDCSNETIEQPNRNGNLYKVYISCKIPSGVITIKNPNADNAYINYGRNSLMDNSLPAIRNQEIRYFKLIILPKLICYDETRERKKELNDVQEKFASAAMIIFNVFPKDLEILFEGNILDISKNDGRYKVYLEPKDQKLNIKCKNFHTETLEFNTLTNHEVRYFAIKKFSSEDIIEAIDKSNKTGNYSINTKPPGALIQMRGNPDFNKAMHRTPFELIDYKVGKEIITLSLPDYEDIVDTININRSVGKSVTRTLSPKFAFINCKIEPPIPQSKIVLDGIELIGAENEKDIKCQKGAHIIEIYSPHYYTESRQIYLAPGTKNELNIKLRPKMGSLVINSDHLSVGAKVIINNEVIGKIPLSIDMQEGTYDVLFAKEGFISDKPSYKIRIEEKNQTIFNDLKMINKKKIKISTYPENDADVYIDNKLLTDKSNLIVDLGIGKHFIKIEKEHFKPISTELNIDNNQDEYKFELEKITYNTAFSSTPTSSHVTIDGKLIGKTPIWIDLSYGKHKVKIEKAGFFTNKKNIFVNKPYLYESKLLKSSYFLLGLAYGLDQYKFNLGYVHNGILADLGLHYNNNKYKGINSNSLSIENVTVEDINLYDIEDYRIYQNDSKTLSFSGRLGITITKPFVFIITIGGTYIRTDKFQKVFIAKHDYIAENSGYMVNKNDLFSVPTIFLYSYGAFTTGLIIPIFDRFYVSSEFYSNSDIGPGVSLGFGLKF